MGHYNDGHNCLFNLYKHKVSDMNERTFTSNVITSLNCLKGVWAYKINDMPIFKEHKTRFTSRKPYDIIVDWSGKYFAIECKFFKGWKALNRSVFQTKKDGEVVHDQLKNLMKHKHCYVFLNVWEKNKFNVCVVLNKSKIQKLMEIGRYTRDELKEMPSTQCHKYIYDFEFVGASKE